MHSRIGLRGETACHNGLFSPNGNARSSRKATLRTAPPVSLLPGIGPGLVWRLEQAGYKTLHDVATAREEDLADQLGALGKLVKLDRWIAFARQHAEQAA